MHDRDWKIPWPRDYLADIVSLLRVSDEALPNAAADEIDRLRAENERLRKALKPFAAAVYNDNGDMTITPCGTAEYAAAYFAMRSREQDMDDPADIVTRWMMMIADEIATEADACADTWKDTPGDVALRAFARSIRVTNAENGFIGRRGRRSQHGAMSASQNVE